MKSIARKSPAPAGPSPSHVRQIVHAVFKSPAFRGIAAASGIDLVAVEKVAMAKLATPSLKKITSGAATIKRLEKELAHETNVLVAVGIRRRLEFAKLGGAR